MFQTLSYRVTALYRSFASYSSSRLQALGLNFGSLFLLIYTGKHPGCSQAELTAALGLDWGYSQRSIARLVEEGFLTREKVGRSYHLDLTEKGREAFAVSHQVFFDWDEKNLSGLTPEERSQLSALLAKAAAKKEHPHV